MFKGNVWDTSEEVLFQIFQQGFRCKLTRTQPSSDESSPPYMFSQLQMITIVNRIFRLYFPMISNNCFHRDF